jgi:hypothetical protein
MSDEELIKEFSKNLRQKLRERQADQELPRAIIHLIVPSDDPSAPMLIGGRGWQQLCDPIRPYDYSRNSMEQATGHPDAVTCPDCIRRILEHNKPAVRSAPKKTLKEKDNATD